MNSFSSVLWGRVGVSPPEDLFPCGYSALCTHTWPSNGVDGNRQELLTSAWAQQALWQRQVTTQNALCSFHLKQIYLFCCLLTSFSGALVRVNLYLYVWARNPTASPSRSVPRENRSHFLPLWRLLFPHGLASLFSMQMWLANVTAQQGWIRPFLSAGVA